MKTASTESTRCAPDPRRESLRAKQTQVELAHREFRPDFEVQAMYERELARQTELAEIRQELYERGALSATDVQQGRRTLAKAQKERPFGYLVRHAPADDVKNLQQLAGHLTESLFITKFRKTFARDEMNDDLSIVPARYNGAEDTSEYEEMLPSSPP